MDLFRVILAFVTVFCLLGFLYFLSNRAKTRAPRLLASARSACSGKFRPHPNRKSAAELDILRRVSLTPTHQLHLVKTAQEIFLVCTHPQGCTVLKTQDADPHANDRENFPLNLERNAS